MANAYTPPETIRARKRADGQKLTLIGAVMFGAGVVGIVLSALLGAVFLGILGGPIGSLAWLSALIGGGLFFWGFTMIRDARGDGV